MSLQVSREPIKIFAGLIFTIVIASNTMQRPS
jgi:hypothetical protein